jgi:hypothetical protein
MWAGGQLINLTADNAVPSRTVRVLVDYGRDRSYGHVAEAEIRELLTHVPVWDGKPGVLRASRTLNADQFFVHARMKNLSPGTQYHYRFRSTDGRAVGTTADATFMTAPGQTHEPFTFTAFGDEGIPGPSLDQDRSLLPESDWEEWNNGSYDSGDPGNPSRTGVSTTNAVILEITLVRNLANRTPSASAIPWMFAMGNHEPELFSARVAADHATVANYEPIGYGGHMKRLDFPGDGPSACPSVYSFRYGNVGIVSLDANDMSWEIQGLRGYSQGAQARWLEGRLAAWRASTDVDFIVAFFHVYERTNPLVYDPATNSAKSSKQAVALSPAEPAEIHPATDGTTYVTVGTAGTPRYGWAGPHESDRNFAAGHGSGTVVHGDARKKTGPYVSEKDFSVTYETVDWSQVRYADCGFIALDVTPAPAGTKTTMTLRFINQQGRELDRAVFSRIAGNP